MMNSIQIALNGFRIKDIKAGLPDPIITHCPDLELKRGKVTLFTYSNISVPDTIGVRQLFY